MKSQLLIILLIHFLCMIKTVFSPENLIDEVFLNICFKVFFVILSRPQKAQEYHYTFKPWMKTSRLVVQFRKWESGALHPLVAK